MRVSSRFVWLLAALVAAFPVIHFLILNSEIHCGIGAVCTPATVAAISTMRRAVPAVALFVLLGEALLLLAYARLRPAKAWRTALLLLAIVSAVYSVAVAGLTLNIVRIYAPLCRESVDNVACHTLPGLIVASNNDIVSSANRNLVVIVLLVVIAYAGRLRAPDYES